MCLRTMGCRPLSAVSVPGQSSITTMYLNPRPRIMVGSQPSSVFRRLQSTAPVANDDHSTRMKQHVSLEETGATPFVPTPERQYQFFRNVEITDSGVAIVRFDCLGKSVNAISFALADEAKALWTNDLENNNDVKAVVFTSAKPNTFIVGADIYDIKRTENKQDLIPVIEGGLKLFQRMRSKGVPLVAAIDGPALGGGLEWCLWCDYRICTDNPKTKVRHFPDEKCVELYKRHCILTRLFLSRWVSRKLS